MLLSLKSFWLSQEKDRLIKDEGGALLILFTYIFFGLCHRYDALLIDILILRQKNVNKIRSKKNTLHIITELVHLNFPKFFINC